MNNPTTALLTLLPATALLSGACVTQSDGYAPGNGPSGKSDGYDQADSCKQWCAVRAPSEADDGWCPVSFDADCSEACRALIETERPDAVERCVTADPLCFVTVEQCLTSSANVIDCNTWCSARRANHTDDGFCEPILQGSETQGCEATCLAGLSAELVPDRVEACIRDNALCFVDLEGCAQTASP